MRYRPLALAAAVATLVSMHVASATAQSAYVAPGGIYIGAGAGPVHVTPGDAAFRAAAYAEPGYDCGYGGAAYVDRYAYGVGAYEEPGYGCGLRTGPVRNAPLRLWIRTSTSAQLRLWIWTSATASLRIWTSAGATLRWIWTTARAPRRLWIWTRAGARSRLWI